MRIFKFLEFLKSNFKKEKRPEGKKLFTAEIIVFPALTLCFHLVDNQYYFLRMNDFFFIISETSAIIFGSLPQ